MNALDKTFSGLRTFASDVAEGFFEITHNSFAMLGLFTVLAVAILGARPDLRNAGEDQLRGWLQERQAALLGMPLQLGAVDRATAANPKELPKAQAAVAYWLSRKYSVAPEPISALVAEAFSLGAKNKLDPTMILAVMAVESSFNPFAQSPIGAQGLMQVMTNVHSDKYQNFGGHFAAFDPVTNLRVGVRVLQECIGKAGSLEGGLRYYVGAANIEDGGYVAKVMAEHSRLLAVAAGRSVPTFTPAAPAPALPSVRPAAPLPVASPSNVEPAQAVADKVAALGDFDTAVPH
ncbi:transglycosylase SLT domain-containing protein [Xylophilus rhododendri]|uniref:Transglycosylase SLT domain-containing protein n=1 Tax=Xylophilus rhododendri TaxID=2697032 RepID=A0A857JAG6_9BURK|nr:lytic transglycosylase domain-containing protein [Xylophilus rhododendri]QHJ00030.1 transglycosylase SLT domain-containing protein [Xylophilus rhododendri]